MKFSIFKKWNCYILLILFFHGHSQVQVRDTVEIAPHIEDTIQQLNDRASQQFKVGDYEAYVSTLRTLESISKHEKTDIILIRSITQQGVGYEKLGKYDKAIAKYLQALEVLETKEELHLDKAAILVNLSNLYNSLEKPKKAISSAREVITLQKEHSLTELLNVSAYNSIGDANLFLKNYERALEEYKKVYELSVKLENTQGQYLSLLSISQCYIYMEKFQKSLEIIDKVLPLAEDDDSAGVVAKATLFKGHSLLYLDQPNKALQNLLEAKKISIKNGYKEIELGAHKLLSITYERLENYKQSLQSQRDYQTSRENFLATLSEVERIQMKKKLDKRALLLNAEQQSKKGIIWFSILSIILLIIIILFILKKKQRITENRKLLSEDNKMLTARIKNLSKQNSDLENHKIPKKKYENTRLEPEEKEYLIKNIIIYIEEERPYLNCELKQQDIAKALSMSVPVLSQILNDSLQRNFNQFINHYRIKEAKKLLIDDINKELTIEAIGYQAGFKSRTSFNRVFKDVEGITPSEFWEKKHKKTI